MNKIQKKLSYEEFEYNSCVPGENLKFTYHVQVPVYVYGQDLRRLLHQMLICPFSTYWYLESSRMFQVSILQLCTDKK